MSFTPLTHAEASQYLTVARNIIEHACNKKGETILKTPKVENFQGPYQIRNGWKDLENALRQTNLSLLTTHQQRRLRKKLSKSLVTGATKAAYLILAREDYYNAYYRFRDRTPLQMLKKAQAKEAARLARAEVARLTGTTRGALPVGAVLAPAPEKLIWPDLKPVTYRVDKAVKELQRSWEQAIKLAGLSDEDQFLLQRIATDYLPDTWRMYTTISDMPDRVTRQAADMLLTQVDVLHDRVKSIRTAQSTSTLQDLRAQTAFINGKKTTRSRTGLLHLS